MKNAKKKRIKKGPRWSRDDSELLLLSFPTIVWYALFSFLPMFGIVIAFKDFKISGNFIQSIISSKWVGLQNFQYMFKSNDAWVAIRNTLGYNIIFIILGVVLPVTLAIIINQVHSKRMQKTYQTVMFMPYFLSWVVVSAVVWAFLSHDHGLLNRIVENAGGEKLNWYMQPKYWPFFLIFLNTWKGIGYSMVVYLATITGIDTSLYEAATIDGATIWKQVKHITLPIMKNVIIMMFILSVGRIFYSDFGLFYQVPRDSNSLFAVTYTLDVMVYKSLKSSTTGMAAASSVLQSIMGCITILVANWVVKKVDKESAII